MNYVNFSLNKRGTIKFLDLTESTYKVNEIRSLVKKLIKNNKILLGTRTEGSIDFNTETFSVNHKVCRPIGGFDSWDEMFVLLHNSDYDL